MVQHLKQETSENLTAFALGELKRRRNDSAIIERVCQQTGWDWREADQFLESVRENHRSLLEAHQNRLSMLVSLSMMVGGVLALIVFVFWVLFNPRLGKFFIPYNLTDWVTILETQVFALAIQSPLTYILYGIALTGIGMILGGVFGFVKSLWRAVVVQR